MSDKNFGIAIHGGAGTVSKTTMTKWKEQAYREALHRALTVGHMILQKGGKSIDAVQEAVKTMEDTPLFNAGKGSVFTHNGEHEMDAAIMDGSNLKAGAVAAVQSVKNPIELCRYIMNNSKHVMLAGAEALKYAKKKGLEIRDKEYFYDEFRFQQWQKALSKGVVELDHDVEEEKKYGTVGAVALDKKGNLAAATSTGGMVNKKYGRVGDSPIIGAGTYASNDSCAVSCTGHGEFFIRSVVAYDVVCLVKYKGMTLEEAAQTVVLQKLKKMGGRGGLIAIDTKGNITMPFNTKGMYRAYKKNNEDEYIGIYKK